MKIAKKVLSILLAVAMVLSMVAVSSSAVMGSASSTYQAKIWLTAEKVSVSYNKMTGKVKSMTGSGNELTGNFDVAAGDVYRIAMYATTNYYVGLSEGAIFFTGGLLDPGEQFYDVAGMASSKAIPTDILGENPNNGWIGYMCSSLTAINSVTAGSVMNETARANMYKKVLDDNGDRYFSDTDIANTGCVKWLMGPDYVSSGITTILGDTEMDYSWATDGELEGFDTTVPLIYFTVMVPSEATAGSTFKVFIPEEERATADAGILTLGYCSEDMACTKDDMVPKHCLLGDDQYFDLSGATLTLKIPGDDQPADLTELQTEAAKYTTAAGFDLANYKDDAAKTKFTQTLALANEELTNQDATSQEYIDQLVDTLAADAAALTPKDIDKTALKTLIDAADLCTLDDYKEDSNWATFTSALADAKTVYNDATLTTIFQQATVDNAKTALENAKNALVALDGCDYSALDTQLARVTGLVETNYTPASWEEYETALSAANMVSRHLKATTANQTIVNNAATALKNAIDGLVEADANYADLQASYDAVKNYAQADYESGWAAFNTALADAKALLDNQNLKAKDQATIDNAKTNLDNAAAALVPYGSADYTALKDAIDAKPDYFAQGANYYNNWDAYADALAIAETLYNAGNLTSKDQATIDNAKVTLNTTKGELTLKDADYTNVDNALAAVPTADDLANYYTADSVSALNTVIAGINRNLKINDQNTVDGYVTAINNAIEGLQLTAADTTALAKAIADAKNKNADFYTADSYSAMTAVLSDAEALYATAGLTKKDNQAAIDTMTSDLNNAMTALVSLGADYSELETQINAFKALTQANYTAASWANANSKALAADTVYKTKNTNPYSKADQSIVDNAATALENAIAALVEKDADYTALNNAKEAANDVLNQEDAATVYTAEYLDGITSALAEATKVPADLKVKDQQTIADAAKAINDAVDAVAYNNYDYTTLNGLKNDWLALASKKDNYTVASWNAVEEAYNALVWDYTYEPTQYGLAKVQDASFAAVMKKLTLAQSANYGALVEAKQAAEALNEADYTEASWADLELALAKVNMNLNENHQAEVDQMVTDINTAIANLAKLASYTDLDAKIAEVAEFYKGTTNIYTQDTLNTLESAYTAATTISRVLTEDEQNQVDNALTTLTNAFNGLALKDADVTALQTACDKFDTYEEAKYTSATWNDYAAAVALGKKAINDKLDITKQGDIDTLLANINDAEKALAEKAVSGKGVFEAASGEVKDTRVANDFTFRVNARAIAIQFIDAYGNTWTFCRTDAKGRVAIKSYDDEGALVGDLNENIEYEDWTITQWLPLGEYTVRAKYGRVWDNENVQTMTIKAATPTDATIYSYELAQTEGWTGAIPVTVVTGADVEAIQVVYADGTITTRSFTEEGGKRTFTSKAIFRDWGESAVTIRAFYGCEWHVVGDLSYNAHK